MKKIKFKSTEFDTILSPLESDVLEVIWPNKKKKVREIYTVLKQKRKVVLCSIAVILDRLYERGIVNREVEKGKGGIHYIYYPKQNREEFRESVVESAVNKLIDKFGQTAVTYFDERFSKGSKK
ncbi:BlaI/MecI/CopY family transcriptional regulator [Candidatus Woesearchaeota archaeon]|nr:BlaI/MecI/CopY family transcriptional regulator [Candidatus Woesearchaeota archaeon]